VKQLNRRNVGIGLDSYHVLTGEGPGVYRSEHMRLVRHVHMSDENRRPPTPGESQAAVLAGLRAAGYDARIAIEARFDDFDAEAPAALAFLRECWVRSGAL